MKSLEERPWACIDFYVEDTDDYLYLYLYL